MRQQRRIGRDDDDDRTLLFGHRRQTAGTGRRGDGHLLPHRRAGDPQLAATAVIGLHEDADGVAARLLRQLA